MSKLPQKHVAKQWVKSWDMLETKKVLNISMVTQIGESQADHIRTKPNGDKKETSPTISTYCRTFFIVSVLLERQKTGHEKTHFSIQIVPPSPKND